MTNQEIDNWILARIQKENQEFPKDRVTNLGLGFCLLNHFGDKLPRTDEKDRLKKSDLWNAQEIANRACQRLRKAGLIRFTAKEKWRMV